MTDDTRQPPPDPFAAFASETSGRSTGIGTDNAAPGRDAPLSMEALAAASLNPLVAAAAPLLVAAPRIRATARHADPAALKQALVESLRAFEAQARSRGLPHEQVVAARYILCTLLDESATGTPWGGPAGWSAHSLLVQFHNETWGGEKVFQLMSRLAEDVVVNRNLLELLYVALAFGFEGRYRVLDNGRAQLDGVRARLLALLRQDRPAPERALSPRWRGEAPRLRAARRGAWPWVAGLGALALALAAVFGVLRSRLADRAAPVLAALSALDVARALPPARVAGPPIAGFLQAEIDAGRVRVRTLPDRAVVTLLGDSFFAPGRSEVSDALRALVPRLATALRDTPGQVQVVGHTDNLPIRSRPGLSNLQLSQERADVVRAALAQSVDPARLRAEGRADTEPLAENRTPAGRARNRRVDVILFTAPPAPNR